MRHRVFVALAAASVSAPAMAQLLFTDTFDSGPAPVWGNERGSWTAAGGEYFATVPGNLPPTRTTLPYVLRDFGLRLKVVEASDGGVWLRYDPGTDSGVLLVTGGFAQSGRGFYWHTFTNGRYSPALNLSEPLFNQGDDLGLTITVTGDHYAVYLGPSLTPATTLDTAAFPTGRVGLYDFAHPRQRFDDVALSPVCPGDWDLDGVVDFNDFLAFLNDYNTPC